MPTFWRCVSITTFTFYLFVFPFSYFDISALPFGVAVSPYLGISKTYASDKLYFIHTDHLSSTVAITDEDGELVSQRRYYPYGSDKYPVSSTQYPDSARDENVTEREYTSQVKDSETNLYYYNARCYDPALGTFVSADTVSDSLNRYAYVRNNPIAFTDPSGHRIWPWPGDEEETISNPYEIGDIYWAFSYSQKEAGIYANKACGPAVFAMVANLYLDDPMTVWEVTEAMRDRVWRTDWPAKLTSRGFVPGVGTNEYGLLFYAQEFEELDPMLFLNQDVEELYSILGEYQQPVIVGTRTGWLSEAFGHLAVLQGFKEVGGEIFVSVKDPYFYATPVNGVDLVASGMGNELLISLPRFQEAFTGEVLVLNAGAPSYFGNDIGGYEYEDVRKEMKALKEWFRRFQR